MGTKNLCINKNCDNWKADSDSGCARYWTIRQCKFSVGLYKDTKSSVMERENKFPGTPMLKQSETELVCNFCGETLTIANHPVFKGRYNTYICSECIIEAMKLLCDHASKNK